MISLGLDTASAHCAVALWRSDALLCAAREEMARGQAERLLVLAEELLHGAGLHWRDLGAIGVGIGPGNFTGIRIAVSAARGLALGLGVPAIGVSRFEVIHALVHGAGLPAVRAPQDQIYVAPQSGPPRLMARPEAEALPGGLRYEPEDLNPAIEIARIAASRAGTGQPRPAPLYIKPADAAPARDLPPEIRP